MLNSIVLMLFVESFGMGPVAIQCEFPGADAADKPIHVVLQPKPSLKDRPGLFRLVMEMNGSFALKAAARPISSTGERDVLIRGIAQRDSMYSIGLRDDGRAALSVQMKPAGSEEVQKSTRLGECRNYEAYLNHWLTS